MDDLDDSDWRKTNPRFTGENFQRNLRIADEVQATGTGVLAGSAGDMAGPGGSPRRTQARRIARPQR